ncbi:MAG TPA: hypothetical protein VGF97_19115 [Rhizomicrobium sp.]
MLSDEARAVLEDPRMAADLAGLRYVSDEEIGGISRRKRGGGFSYHAPDGRLVRDRQVLARIRALAIPPAWTSVWISPFADAHLAATGRDAKGRKQYRYNPAFVEVRDEAKFQHVLRFVEALPALRRTVADDMALRGMPRNKVLATIVCLLEATLIRIGNEHYARENGSFGLTTLRDRHVTVSGSELRFLFPGKSGKLWRLRLNNRRVARVIRACQELPGQHLFQYRDDAGALQRVSSNDVNDYLRAATGHDITAKDFRTWAGTVAAATALQAIDSDSGGANKKQVRAALGKVAALLGNTIAVCRKCYVHPEIFAAYEEGALRLPDAEAKDGLEAVECAVYALLKRRMRQMH